MNTVIFSTYDCYRSSALFLDDETPIIEKNVYRENLKYSVDIEEWEDDVLFDFFSEMFGKPIQRIIVITDSHVYKIRYNGKYFHESKCKFFGRTFLDENSSLYVSTINKKPD